MTQYLTSARLSATAVLAAVALAACGDDDTTAPPPPNAPPTPAGLQLCRTGPGAVRVQWQASTGATGYTVERVQSSAPTGFTRLGTSTTTSLDDTGLAADLPYFYRVSAFTVSGTDTARSAPSDALSFTGAPSATGARVVLAGDITCNQTLSRDTTYVLRGYVKVRNGATLTIQSGTTVVGDQTAAGSSLWILRGARIDAQGTAAQPIVFTSNRAAGSRAPGDWGGIIIVGNGVINRTGTVLTEGPTNVAENYAGGTNNADNSGTLRYVRIEYAGFDVSGGGNSELNGLSMYAVGSGTTLEYVQTLAGLDDSFEVVGGAVDGRYLVSYESGDDHFDWAEGYVGRLQYLIAYQNARLIPTSGTGVLSTDPQGFEVDGCAGNGCANGTRSAPFSDAIVANFTVVGLPTETQSAGGRGLVLRRGMVGALSNGIVTRWPSNPISIRDTSVTLYRNAGDSLAVLNVVLFENGTRGGAQGTIFEASSNPAFTAAEFQNLATTRNANLREATAAVLTNLSPTALDFRPTGIATSGCNTAALPARVSGRLANFFGGTLTIPAYCGAVDPAQATPWYSGWTRYSTNS